jgi:hypothetical protein
MRAGDSNKQNVFEGLLHHFENEKISNEDRFLGHVGPKSVWVDVH